MITDKNLIPDQDRDFKVLKRQILKDKGFDCNQYRDNYVKRRLAIRMRANNVDSCKDYAMLLKREPTELFIPVNAREGIYQKKVANC